MELEEATPGRTVTKRRTSRGELYRLIREARRNERPQLALEEIAAERGYKPGWVAHVMRAYGIQ